MMSEVLQQSIKHVFVRLLALDDPGHTDEARKDVTKVQRRHRATPVCSASVRRGAVFEYSKLLHQVPETLKGHGVTPANLKPAGNSEPDNTIVLEMLREAESLVLQPHSFAALRQIPELQQIISHTAVTAVTACAGQMAQMHVLYQTERQAEKHKSSLTGSAADSQAGSALTDYRCDLLGVDAKLFDHLAPAVRLCLAAEVAKGVLCSSQPAPPDTPEHAAALGMFVDEAYEHVEAELKGRTADVEAYSQAAAVEDAWQHLHQQQHQQGQEQQQQPERPRVAPPRGTALSSWQLSPHLDLHAHLPPHQLLLLLLQLCQLTEPDHQRQQQQGGECSATAEGTAAAAADTASSQGLQAAAGVGLPVDVHQLHENYIDQLALMVDPTLPLAAEVVSPLRQTGRGLDAGSLAAQAAQTLLQYSHNGVHASCSQQQQQVQGQLNLQAVPDGRDVAATATQNAQGSAAGEAGGPSTVATAADHDDGTGGQIEGSMEKLTSEGLLLTYSLLVQFITEQWHAAAVAGSSGMEVWQQAVPLQVVLLYQQVKYIAVLITRSCILAKQVTQHADQSAEVGSNNSSSNSDMEVNSSSSYSDSDDSVEGSDSDTDDGESIAANTPQQQQQRVQQQLLQQLLVLLQLLRHFKASNEELLEQASSQQAVSSILGELSNSTDIHSHSHSLISSSLSEALEPARFFSVDGPLAAGRLHSAGLTGQGVWSSGRGSYSSSSIECRVASDCLHVQGDQAVAAGSTAAPPACAGEYPVAMNSTQHCNIRHKQQQQQQRHNQLLWETFLGCCCWQRALAIADEKLLLCLQDQGANLMSDIVAAAWAQPLSDRDFDRTRAVTESFTEHNLPVLGGIDWHQLLAHSAKLTTTAAELLLNIRCKSLEVQGYDVKAWWSRQLQSKAALQQAHDEFEQQLAKMTRLVGSLHVIDGSMLDEDEFRALMRPLREAESQFEAEWEVETVESDTVTIGSTLSSSTGEGDSSGTVGDGQDVGSSSSSTSSARWHVQSELDQAHKAHSRLGGALGQLFTPLYLWHQQWMKQHYQATQQAREWSKGDRLKVAAKGAVHADRTAYLKGGGSSSARSGSRSGSGGTIWRPGQHDYHKQCPLCQQELQQQQQQQTTSHSQDKQEHSSSSTGTLNNPFTRPAVSPCDPFMWRRLLWQLLGKLSPAAQAFYAQYLAMCPHCMDVSLWCSVSCSITQCLWSPPTADVVDLQLVAKSHISKGHNKQRPVRIKQYATAINDAYMQDQSPAAVLVAKQLLLSLSSLHQSVLPPADVAPYLPSSFTPAVGKLLQQQIINRPVLDMFAHDSCWLLPWHVWWHVGVRRYHSLVKPGAFQPHTADHTANQQSLQGAGCSSSNSLNAVYDDPDARLYAVGFAMRQLNGLKPPAADGSSPHTRFKATQAAAAILMQNAQWMYLIGILQHSNPELQQLSNSDKTYKSLLTINNELKKVCRCAEGDAVAAAVKLTTQPTDVLDSAARIAQQEQHVKLQASAGMRAANYYLDRVSRKSAKHSAKRSRKVSCIPGLQQDSSMSDVEQLALLSPAPVDALVDQKVWWRKQQLLLQSANTCDNCFEPLDKYAITCEDCLMPDYCSPDCKEMAAKHHQAMCSKLQAVKQRYAPTSRLQQQSLGSQTLKQRRQQQPSAVFQGLLDLLTPAAGDAWPGGSNAELLTSLPAGLVTQDLWVTEAGRVFEEQRRFKGGHENLTEEELAAARACATKAPKAQR